MRVANFTFIVGQLYKLGSNEILYRYVLEHERRRILEEVHAGITGGHYAENAIVQKVLIARIWWPTIHKDAKEFCRCCDACQRTRKPSRRDDMSLKPKVTLQAFNKSAIDFVGPINPPGKCTGSKYIITTTNYLTRWAEATPVKYCNIAIAAQIIFENIFTRFGCPHILMSDQGTHFLHQTIQLLTEEF